MAHSVSVLPALGCSPTLRASAADLHRSLLRLQLRNLQVRLLPALSRPFAARGSSLDDAASSHRFTLTPEPVNRLSTAGVKGSGLATKSGKTLRTSMTHFGLCHFVA